MQTVSTGVFFDGYGSRISFSTREDFESIYQAVRCFNQEDPRKNANDLSECWAISTYLINLIKGGLITFPTQVEKMDPPDFKVIENGAEYALEIVRMTSNVYKYLRNIVAKGEYFEPSNLDSRFEVRFSAEEVKRNLKNWGEPLSGRGWYGDQPHQQAAALFSIHLERKLTIINSPNFKFQGPIDLMVHNDSHIYLGSSWPEVRPYLVEAARLVYSSARYQRTFRKIHFLTGGLIVYDIERDGRILVRNYRDGMSSPFDETPNE